MKILFDDLGEHKIKKAIEIDLGAIAGFNSVADFILCEVIPHLPYRSREPDLELVHLGGQGLVTNYVVVLDGILSVGNVALYQ